jgi:hypothetical protein
MSNKVVVGFFPKKICYVSSCKRNVSVGCEWDIDYGVNAENKTEEVLPAFPADNDDTKSISTATNWAKSDINYQNYSSLNKKAKEDLPDPGTEVIDNQIITNVRLLTIEQRGSGGRAYKAIVNNYYVDVREDVVMDTMLQEGIDAGGVLRGEFIWARCGAQMKLVRKDSELYKLIAEFESKRDLKPVSKKKLEVGGVYRSKTKEAYIYLGNVNTTHFSIPDKDNKTTPYWDHVERERFDNDKKCLNFDKQEIKNKMLFFKIYKHQTTEKALEDLLSVENTYRFELKQSHTFIEKTEQLDLDSNIVSKIAAVCARNIKENILEYTGHKAVKANHAKLSLRGLANNISYSSVYLNMYNSNEEKSELFDVQKYLLFS